MTPITYPSHSVHEEKLEASNQSGALWKCLFRSPDLFAGYRYTFCLKEEYDDVTPQDPQVQKAHRLAAIQKRKEIFPAGEYLGSEIRYFTPACQYAPYFHRLGYEMKSQTDGLFLVLPDREAILSRWQFLRLSRPDLPALKILAYPGLADDKTFIEAFCSHDALLSSGKLFMHDHFHLLRTLVLMFDSGVDENPTYQAEKNRLVKLIHQAYRPLQQAEKLLKKTPTIPAQTQLNSALKELASQVDYIWARQDYEESEQWTKKSERLIPLWKEIDTLTTMLKHTNLQNN